MSERVFVDRIDAEHAVLVCGPSGEETARIPARMLPAGAGEGAALDLTLALASGDTNKQEVENLLGELFSDTSPSV